MGVQQDLPPSASASPTKTIFTTSRRMETHTLPGSHFFDFLNTSQSGVAHLATGAPMSTIASSLGFSFGYFIVQVAVFSLLRPHLHEVYQLQRLGEKVGGFFTWVVETWRDSILEFAEISNDAYYFLRFLVVLVLVILVPIGTINICVLIPILVVGNKGHSRGLDRLSISNVPPEHTGRYIAHFVLAMIDIVLVQYVIFKELQGCTDHRCEYMSTRVSYNRVLLVSDIPKSELDRGRLFEAFEKFYGGVEDVWLIPDYRRLENMVEVRNKLVDMLEKIRGTATSVEMIELQRHLKIVTGQIMSARERLLTNTDSGYFGKAFICFNSPIGAYMAKQTLVFGEAQYEMNHFMIEVDPEGIIWPNMTKSPGWVSTITSSLANFLCLVVTVGWVVPVSFVALITQLPYLTTLVPHLGWINKSPQFIKDIISGMLPTVTLTCLTEIAQLIFRRLSLMSGVMTMSQLELHVQKWYFAFLFVQVFLVVTISSGVMVIVESVLYNPTSLATIVARDLPRASSFFYSFFLLRGFTICGNVLLRFTELVRSTIYYRFVDTTERRKEKRDEIRAPRFRLGMLYPTVSLFGSIALVYSILAPLILVCACVSLALIFIGYKYCFKNVYHRQNASETNGQLYAVALLQLYSGIYCLEICLIGFFGIVRNKSGEACLNLSMGMIIVFVCTVITHVRLNKRFSRAMAVVPVDQASIQPDRVSRLSFLPACFRG